MEDQVKAVEVKLPFLCSHKLWRRGNRHLLICISGMSGGGVSVLEKALDHLRGLKVDDEDKLIQLSNSSPTNGWKWRGPLSELPFKNSQEGKPQIGDGPIRVYDAQNLYGPTSEVPADVLEALGGSVFVEEDDVSEYEEITEKQLFRYLGIRVGTKVTVEELRMRSLEHPFVTTISGGKVVHELPVEAVDEAPF